MANNPQNTEDKQGREGHVYKTQFRDAKHGKDNLNYHVTYDTSTGLLTLQSGNVEKLVDLMLISRVYRVRNHIPEKIPELQMLIGENNLPCQVRMLVPLSPKEMKRLYGALAEKMIEFNEKG